MINSTNSSSFVQTSSAFSVCPVKERSPDEINESRLSEIPQISPIQSNKPPLVSTNHEPLLGDDESLPKSDETSFSEALKHITKPPRTSTLVPRNPEDENHKPLKELVERFEQLRLELLDLDGERIEQTIQNNVLNEKRVLIDKFNNLSVVFTKINENINKNNEMIEKINAELGVKYPLEDLKEFSVSDINDHLLNFAAAERERADDMRGRLCEEFEVRLGIAPLTKQSELTSIKAVKLDISMVLGITTMTAPSLINIEPTKSKDNTVEKILADNASLQTKLDAALKAQAQAEAAMELYKNRHPISNDTQKENTASEQDSERIEASLPYYRVLAQFCSRVRHGFHHSGRRIHHGGAILEIEGRGPASKEVIDARNKTCHEGDISADFSLFMVDPNRTGWNVGGERYIDFTKSYRITPEECKTIFLFSKSSPPKILLDPLNMHATMYRCYFKTIYCSNNRNDKDFEASFERLFVHYKRLLATNGLTAWSARYASLVNFLKNEKQGKNSLELMKQIVQNTVAHEISTMRYPSPNGISGV
ncbi:hypothetical protein NHQ30_005607 [Ciborinia camelliae]|nr:hypothetical protein NHQ30_005607 [Ciborinia camelliae]